MLRLLRKESPCGSDVAHFDVSHAGETYRVKLKRLRRRSPLYIEISRCDAGCRLNDSGTRKTHRRKSLCRKASALDRLQAALVAG